VSDFVELQARLVLRLVAPVHLRTTGVSKEVRRTRVTPKMCHAERSLCRWIFRMKKSRKAVKITANRIVIALTT